MKFSVFSTYLQKLEETSKRLEITSILADLIDKLSPDEIDKGIYLSLGYLKAEFESEKFNMAEKMVIKSLEKAYPQNSGILKKYDQMGDLGSVVFELHRTKGKTDPNILTVHQKLLKIAQLEGSGSQEAKITSLAELLKEVDELSAKYIVRIVLGTTRLGFTELTIIDAFSKFLKDDKSLKKQIEGKYFIHPDIGLIAKKLKTKGVSGIASIVMEPGVPVLAQKAQRLGSPKEIMEKLGMGWAEFKFDGTRVQLHMDKNKKFTMDLQQQELFSEIKKADYLIKTFTRNLEDSTHQHPDIVQAAMTQIKADSVILDGEAIGIDKKTGEFLPFQQIMQRKRKHGVKKMADEIPLVYFVFDILYKNGKSLIDKPLEERHKIMAETIEENSVMKITEYLKTDETEKLINYFNQAKEKNLEGLIIKKPQDPYQAGARSYSWVKLKTADEKLLEDSLDVVVLGYFYGKGERSKLGIGKFLAGIYDEDSEKFKTITKVGTGLTDEDWKKMKKLADKHKTNKPAKNVDYTKHYQPDVYTEPAIVVEIGGDEISDSKTHSSKYALRFPRLLNFRPDKDPTQATTLKEVKNLYSLQKRGNYKN
jgi:DNA ligase-1